MTVEEIFALTKGMHGLGVHCFRVEGVYVEFGPDRSTPITEPVVPLTPEEKKQRDEDILFRSSGGR